MLMRKLLAASAMSLVMGVAATAAMAAEPDACKTIRIADVGWSDNTAQNGLLKNVVKPLGYEVKESVLGLPIILEGLKNKDLDLFLDNWMPSNASNVKPYLDEKSIDSLQPNLTGAKYGPVVPQYVADAGVKSLADLAANTDKFDGKFYGIEPGNDGNKSVQAKIDDPANKLDGWELVESSEQGMLVQAEKAIKKQEWIAFLAWVPHPVMAQMQLHYLSGFEDSFGDSEINALTRPGYSAECANIGKLLANLKFEIDMESTIMGGIGEGKDGETAAAEWLKANPAVLDTWLAGVTTFDGQEGGAAVKKALGL
jgi:glycine betaine/proline transport system substrate-binding protein